MLARLAENLFWAGRYIERAEDTARMVDVTYHTLLESPPREVAQAWEQLLEVLHLAPQYHASMDDDPRPTPTKVIEFLVIDRRNPGAIVSSVIHARENGRSVRELVSSELYEAVNELYLILQARDLGNDLAEQPYDLFRLVKQWCQTISGTAVETMPRDDAWGFLTLGRQIERAEMTCRLLNVRYHQLVQEAGPLAFHDWVAVLKSVSALEAFRKRYRASMEAGSVVEFLLLSREFPRSVLFALMTAETQIRFLSRGRPSSASRQLGRVRASLEYRDLGELMDQDLRAFLDDVQEGIGSVADRVAGEFFHHAPDGALHSVATA